MRTTALVLCAQALLAAVLLPATPATASPGRPLDLRVKGGEDAWHADNRFTIEWTNPATAGGAPLTVVHYRIRDPLGAAIAETQIGWVSDGIADVTVPKVPGAYSVEVWFEDSARRHGPAAGARLRFDDTRPASIEVQAAPRWIGRAAFPLRVRLGHPPGPAPIAGIRGYAVAIDGTGPKAPCAAPDLCTDAETTLHGGAGDDTLTVTSLPEGISHLRAVAVSGSGMKSTSSAHVTLRVDTTAPTTQLAGAPGGWTNRSVDLLASAVDAGSGMAPDGDGPPPFTAIRLDDGAPAIVAGSHATATAIAEGAHLVTYYARDAAGNVDDGETENGVAADPPRTAWVRIDRGAPGVAFANSEDPRDPDLLRVRIADGLSGADLGRGWVGVRRAGSGDRFQPLPPASPGPGELRARWDSDAYPRGEYEFRAVGYDEAGNATATARRHNGDPMVISNPLKAVTTLSALLGAGASERTVPYGRGVHLGGRLVVGRGAPLDGTPVRVVERFDPGASEETRVSSATTGPGGTFSLRLAAGPSREVRVSFAGGPTLARSASRPLRVGVRSSVRLRASSAVAVVGGAPVLFQGRVAVRPATIPRQGLPVQLQFRLPGLPWAEFRTVATDRQGRFRYSYRFSDDDSRGARFQFRAYVAAQDDWPYEPGGSRPVIVRGG